MQKKQKEKLSKESDPEKLSKQPVTKIEWIHHDDLTANDYNPNNVFPKEMELLHTSVLEDGWTLPIVITSKNEIIDGEHRWYLTGVSPEVYDLTNGWLPCVRLKGVTDAHRMSSTVRYNRARGVHAVMNMADIVIKFSKDFKMSNEEIATQLGMEVLEVELFLERGDMLKRGSKKQFNQGWKPGKKVNKT